MLELKGRGLFVFSDPGGAKPILALALSLQQSLDDFLILSDREYAFFKDFNIPVLVVKAPPQYYIASFEPDFIFTGTSYTSTIELTYIAEAKTKGIKSYAYIDHWTSIRKRFDDNGSEIFPDAVCVIDEKAKNIAIEEGIEASSIKIVGNPYHQFLKNWLPSISKAAFFEKLSINTGNKNIVLYAPDPLSNVNGTTVFGFDEIMATKSISHIATQLKDSHCFILKPHPNQNLEKLKESINEHIIVVDKNADANSLIYYADCVIGFFSSFLIEALVMQKPVFRFAVKPMKTDPFKDMLIGQLVNKKDLLNSLSRLKY
jgi:hypothetical protein